MRIRRRLPLVFGVLLVILAVALVVVLRKHAPPEPARLLPAADGFAYVNLELIRLANFSGKLPAVSHEPEYEKFIQETGFQFERDLDRAALAIHYSGGSAPGNTASGEARFSEVMVGKIDGERLQAYLKKLSSSVDSAGSIDIYNIPLEGRTLRVAILGVDTVAASNQADPEVIRGIIARSRKLASPFGGPSLLRQYYKHVPLASLAWIIAKTGGASASSNPGEALNPSFLFPKPAVIVGSVRYLGAVHLRAEAFTGSEDAAARVTEQLKAFINIFSSAEISVAGGSGSDVKQLFTALKVEQHKDRAVLSATVPISFIQKLVAEAPNEAVSVEAPARAVDGGSGVPARQDRQQRPSLHKNQSSH